MGIKRSIMRITVAVLLAAMAMWAACGGGGGGGSSEQATSVTFNASAAAGDLIKFTFDSADNSYTYDNLSTGRFESGTYTKDPATGELSFTADTSNGGGSGDGSATELATGFFAQDIGVVMIATNTSDTKDKESLVFGVPQRTHSLDELIGLVEQGSGGTAEYIRINFRTNDGGFALGTLTILEEQDFTDTLDIDNDGDTADTITGAPVFSSSYSPVYGMPDPVSTDVPMTFSTDIVDPTSTPFLELALDGFHVIMRSWQYDTCDKGDPGCTPTLAKFDMFVNGTVEKLVIDTPYGNMISLKMNASAGWSSTYEGTYTLASYVGSGSASSNQDTAGISETLELTFGNDGSGNGTVSIGPLTGPDSITDQPLATFNQMASADSLLGSVVSQWPTDGSIPLNGVFGFRGAGGDIGEEYYFAFSEGTVFMVYAQLNGTRDGSGRPAQYSYQFGAGLKMP